MDEFTAIMRARELVQTVGSSAIPVSIQAYLDHVGAKLKLDKSMGADEAGCTIEIAGKRVISVNANDQPQRRNFTVCHELAHIVLGLPTEHEGGPSWSYAKRTPNEIACDVFAAELLLPFALFKPLVDKADAGFSAITDLARQFEASLTVTGSRFAVVNRAPCAFVLAEQGKKRYASCSKELRDAKAWIPRGASLPKGSLAEKLRNGGIYEGPEEVAADLWFDNWDRGGELLEDARYFKPWDQTLSLIWFEDEVPAPPRGVREEEEEVGLRELDGVLPWPGKSRRRR